MRQRIAIRAIVMAIACSFSPLARAAAVSFSAALPLVPTNSTQNLQLPKFDPNLGALQSIEIMMAGHVEGMVRFESRDASPRVINIDLSAKLELHGPDSSLLGFTVPVVSVSRNATAYDGVTDFGGSSGETINGLSTDMALGPIPLPVETYGALFTGSGDVLLPVISTGLSTGSGGGNLIIQISTFSSAQATVTYSYVPEPSTLAGLLLLACLGRRRRS